MKLSKAGLLSGMVFAMMTGVMAPSIMAKTVKVTMTAMENTVKIDNKGTKYAAWTYDGAISGRGSASSGRRHC